MKGLFLFIVIATPTRGFNTHLLSTSGPTHVRVGTDSTVARAAYARGFNTHSWDINSCLQRLREAFGTAFTFDYVHVPGVSNPADSFSRGLGRQGALDKEIALSLRRLVGSNTGVAGQRGSDSAVRPS